MQYFELQSLSVTVSKHGGSWWVREFVHAVPDGRVMRNVEYGPFTRVEACDVAQVLVAGEDVFPGDVGWFHGDGSFYRQQALPGIE